MTQVAVDDGLANEAQRLSGLSPENIVDIALKSHLEILRLHDRWNEYEQDDSDDYME